MDDRQITKLLMRDAERGLACLLQQYGALVQAICARVLINRPQDTEECIQDTFFSAWRHAEDLYKTKQPLAAWLAVTAKNKAIDRYRRLRRSQDIPMEEIWFGTEEILQQQEDIKNEAEEIIAALPQPDREIFIRKYYLLQPTTEIAAAMRLTENAVNTRLSRRRRALRAQYAAKGEA